MRQLLEGLGGRGLRFLRGGRAELTRERALAAADILVLAAFFDQVVTEAERSRIAERAWAAPWATRPSTSMAWST